MLIKVQNIQCVCTKKKQRYNEKANIECNLHVQVLRVSLLTGFQKISRRWLWNHTQCTTFFQLSQNAEAVSFKDVTILQRLCGNQ